MYRLLGIKKLMSQIFDEEGQVIPVTIIDLSETHFAGVINNKNYVGIGKKRNPSSSQKTSFKNLDFVPNKIIETESSLFENTEQGGKVNLSKLDNVRVVNVIGHSKGKGFAGVVKRWGFRGGPKTHGQSDRNRAAGSIGGRTTPGRVYKGKRMAGRMGNEQITVKNLRLVKVDTKNRLLFLKGAVPGACGSVVEVCFLSK